MEAGLDETFHPHNFRHLLLTTLGGDGWTDTELQNVSGHRSRTSLDSYIQKNPERIRTQYNDSINRLMGEV
jgi:integrase